jgi:formylglycine-generating enzyme
MEKMIRCPFCGEQILEIAKKCKHCGEWLNSIASAGDTVNAVFSADYEILGELGRGGMATVYKARQKNLDRIVALKVIPRELTHDQEFVGRFEREARNSARLNHPNTITIYDVGSIGGYPYISMEYLEGGTLSERLRIHGKLAESEAKEIITKILKALGQAHQQGIIHRDLKSSNIMLDAGGRPVLMDFGIARSAEGTKLTKTGTIMGTPEYMSPEQAAGTGEVDQRSDLYSIGVVLYELLTGRVPFHSDTALGILHKVVNEEPQNPITLNSKISVEMNNILHQALAKDPEERFQSADEFITALESGKVRVISKPANKKPVRRPEPQPVSYKESEGMPAAMKIVLVLLILGILGIGGYLLMQAFPSRVLIPEVVGMQYNEASSLLKENGLASRRGEKIKTYDERQDKVAAQYPKAQSEVKKGTELRLDVYDLWRKLPDVSGYTLADAKSVLASADIKITPSTNSFHPKIAKGRVIEIKGSPQELPTGSSVTLVISQGIEMSDLPDLRNITLNQAKSKLETAGFKLGNTITIESSHEQAGLVVSSNPKAGNHPKGSKIDLSLSLGKSLLPDLKGKTQSQTEQILGDHTSSEGIKMSYVEGGSFNNGTSGVTVSSFYIGKYEVTQEQYEKVMGKNPSSFKNSGKNAPVEQVSWYDAVEFCNKLSNKEGLQKCYSGSGNSIKCDFSKNGYRLPTEAEWEYAAKGGSKSKGYKYSGSNNLDEVGWYGDNSGGKTHSVGGKKSNELGIYDMSGNVWEWCWDWYGSYSSNPQTDPRGPSSGSGRVNRGGCWFSIASRCRAAYRIDFSPGRSDNDLGFRLARSSR